MIESLPAHARESPVTAIECLSALGIEFAQDQFEGLLVDEYFGAGFLIGVAAVASKALDDGFCVG
jgi:hypothetical protein